MNLAGQIALGVYAILLGIGGLIGHLKAGSRPSLIAGLLSAVAAALCLIASLEDVRLGFILGAILAALLLTFFGQRFAQGRKFMPAGLMALVSLALVVFLVILILRESPNASPPPGPATPHLARVLMMDR
jgi:uncharacterized membrane protein (UPF0136 family)